MSGNSSRTRKLPAYPVGLSSVAEVILAERGKSCQRLAGRLCGVRTSLTFGVESILEVLKGQGVLQNVTTRYQRVSGIQTGRQAHVSETSFLTRGAAWATSAVRTVAATAYFIVIE